MKLGATPGATLGVKLGATPVDTPVDTLGDKARPMGWFKRVRALFTRRRQGETPPRTARRGTVNHVIIIDGTMSSLEKGRETNAALTYKLLCDRAPAADMSLYYDQGVQWDSWRKTLNVVRGRGINRQIRRAYGHLASRYRPGDRIFLFGYSRGAFAVRSLAGVIDRIGLLRPTHATERNVRQAWRHYEFAPASDAAKAFTDLKCHPIGCGANGDAGVTIEMIGVWDTVKALGFRAPLLWRLVDDVHEFHNHELGHSVRHGYHALALDETRQAFAPLLWTTSGTWQGNVEQMWFKGAHGDIGGQLGGFEFARPLSNIPLVWILSRAESLGLRFPEGWRARFPRDASAPAVGSLRSWGKLFLNRRRRIAGRDPSEQIHESARGHGGGVRILRGDLNAVIQNRRAADGGGNGGPNDRPNGGGNDGGNDWPNGGPNDGPNGGGIGTGNGAGKPGIHKVDVAPKPARRRGYDVRNVK